MRIMPCRVVCYYKFNVKSGSKKMREGGLGIWNGSIHLLFLLVSKCAGRKKARQERLISKKRNYFIPDQTVKPLSPFGLVQLAVYCIHQWRYGRPICACSFTFLPQRAFSERKTPFISDSHYRCMFLPVSFVKKAHVRSWTRFSIPEVSFCIVVCQRVSEENESWKRPLFWFALSRETGP